VDELQPAHHNANITTLSALECPACSNSPTKPTSPAGCPVQVFHLGLNLLQKLKVILPQTHKNCHLSAHGKITKCLFAAFFPTRYERKHVCAHLSAFISPSLARTQGTLRTDTCTACWRGKNKCIKEPV